MSQPDSMNGGGDVDPPEVTPDQVGTLAWLPDWCRQPFDPSAVYAIGTVYPQASHRAIVPVNGPYEPCVGLEVVFNAVKVGFVRHDGKLLFLRPSEPFGGTFTEFEPDFLEIHGTHHRYPEMWAANDRVSDTTCTGILNWVAHPATGEVLSDCGTTKQTIRSRSGTVVLDAEEHLSPPHALATSTDGHTLFSDYMIRTVGSDVTVVESIHEVATRLTNARSHLDGFWAIEAVSDGMGQLHRVFISTDGTITDEGVYATDMFQHREFPSSAIVVDKAGVIASDGSYITIHLGKIVRVPLAPGKTTILYE
ncbi:MAG: hypothetical protein MO852_15475, partial [Candidatus Devosia euplotis]|nr:hypothetical protein [Candidatus Devosia euplotis]